MQNQITDTGNFSNIENSFNYQDDDRSYQDLQTLIQQLQGARQKFYAMFQLTQVENQNDLQQSQENNYCESLENSDFLNSKEIKISYFESKQIENLLKSLYDKIEFLKEKQVQRANKDNLEKQIYSITEQLSKERLKQPKNLQTVQGLKAQLKEKSKQLFQKYETINKHIKEMLKPVDNEEQDEDVNFVI
ncbi:unnamed protein product [Paramecium pentaurelia]|uniref:Uncharacterized protein n=1 Tax=Paramecium pentaurelia TaxID=43138 RepID=A0A8S1W8Y4_9CILI|nr:unnamed protein product [Paramecium pentaurelia]